MTKDTSGDPAGGLTAAGRKTFLRKDGAHLKPGVRHDTRGDEAQRQLAVRFYGRAGKLPPLKDASGRPTRFALTAHAWGEPVPATPTAARRIAEKGRRLLQRYRMLKERS